MSCQVYYCYANGNHWKLAKEVYYCYLAGNHWKKAKELAYRKSTTAWQGCNTSKPVVGSPGSHSVTAGTVVKWAATASNYDTLQWQYKYVGGAWINHGTHRGVSWSTTPVNTGQNGEQFRLVATNKWGVTAGPAGTMTVKAPAVAAVPIVVGHINDPKEVTAGSALNYTTSAKGPIAYGHWKIKHGSGAWANISGTSSKPGSNGLITMGGHYVLKSSDNGAQVQYCAYDSGGHSHCTNVSHLHVTGGTSTGGGSKPRITGMAGIRITIPHAFQFHPHITGAGHITISWQYYDGHKWVAWGSRHTATDGSGSAESPRVTRYRVVAKNAGGTVTSEATLTAVKGSSHTTTPVHTGSKPSVGHVADVHITDGGRYTFKASVSGATSVAWFYRSGSSGTWHNWNHNSASATGGPVSGTSMNGWYFKCQATNSKGHTDSNVARLFIAAKSSSHTTPTSTFHPAFQWAAQNKRTGQSKSYNGVSVHAMAGMLHFNGDVSSFNAHKLLIRFGGAGWHRADSVSGLHFSVVQGWNIQIANAAFRSQVRVKWDAQAFKVNGVWIGSRGQTDFHTI